MLLRLPQVLIADDIVRFRQRLDKADWSDGRVTGGFQSAKVKENLQLPEDSADSRELGAVVLGALGRNPLFTSAALPRFIFPPLFNKYAQGMSFGAHVDNAVRQIPGTLRRIRTDLSATLFLNGPEEYDGGELLIEGPSNTQSVKLAAGDMVLYPATTLHRVAPVTRGIRLAAFFWVQSMVKDEAERGLLFDIDRSIAELSQAAPDSPALVRLTACYHNLVRKWGEV